MGVVMTAACRQFRASGASTTFSAASASRRWPRSAGVEIPIDQFRQTYQDRLQQLGRQLGHPLPPDQASALGLDRQVLGEMVGPGRARPARPADAARHFRRRDRPAHHGRSELANPNGQVRPRQVRSIVLRNMGTDRATLRRRAAADDAAPADHRLRVRRHRRAESLARRHQSVPEPNSAASNMWRSARRRPATFRSRPTDELQQIFRRAQNAVPRAGIPQDRRPSR